MRTEIEDEEWTYDHPSQLDTHKSIRPGRIHQRIARETDELMTFWSHLLSSFKGHGDQGRFL